MSVFPQIERTAVWRDISRLPEALAMTIGREMSFDDAIERLCNRDVRRIVVTGNGASYYAGFAAWLATLEGTVGRAVDVQCVPSGLLARGTFTTRPGDAILAVSVSGEFRDLTDAIAADRLPRPLVAVTAYPESSLARNADAVAQIHVDDHGTVTHTQDFCNATVACLAIIACVVQDRELRLVIESIPELVNDTIMNLEPWVEREVEALDPPTAAIAIGHGTAWAGALELSLLLKEIARIPSEGLETREGATSALTGLHSACLVVGLASKDDPFLDEAERLCASSGAAVLRIPFGSDIDRRVVPVTSFPAGAALSVALALESGLDPDRPWWIETYFATARAANPKI